jgi:hypothetical protein
MLTNTLMEAQSATFCTCPAAGCTALPKAEHWVIEWQLF